MAKRGAMRGRVGPFLTIAVLAVCSLMLQHLESVRAGSNNLIPATNSSSESSPAAETTLSGSSLVNHTATQSSTPAPALLPPSTPSTPAEPAPSTPAQPPPLIPAQPSAQSSPLVVNSGTTPLLVPPPSATYPIASNPVPISTPAPLFPSVFSPSLVPPSSGPAVGFPSIPSSVPQPVASVPSLLPAAASASASASGPPLFSPMLSAPASNPNIFVPPLLPINSLPPISLGVPVNVSRYTCETGIEITYTPMELINAPSPDKDFRAVLTVINRGVNSARNWSVSLRFDNDVTIKTVMPPMMLEGPPVPQKIVGGSRMVLIPMETHKVLTGTVGGANDSIITETNVTVGIAGSIFGVSEKDYAVPKMINFSAMSYYSCNDPVDDPVAGLVVCCNRTQQKPEELVQEPGNTTEYTGIKVLWDIIEPNALTYYTVLVRIKNLFPYKTIVPEEYSCPYDELKPQSGWCLRFDWKHNEYISSVKGCTTTYKGNCNALINSTGMENVTSAYSCDRSPTLMDLEPRLGALSPEFFDPGASVAEAMLVVGKQESDWSESAGYYFPTNFSIGLPGYRCSTPELLMEPSKLPTEAGSRQMMSALKSWTVSCGPNLENAEPKQCCVSLSGIYNKTLAPCMSCACNQMSPCNSDNPPCELNLPATPQPAMDGVLTGSREDYILPEVPKKLLARQCKSGCGQQVHFHLSKIEGGTWTMDARVENMLTNDLDNWMVAVQFHLNVSDAMVKVHSVNNTKPDSTGMSVFFGFKDYNEILKSGGAMTWQIVFNSSTLLAQFRGVDPALLDPTQQITSKEELAIRVDQRMMPLKVLFMGKECAMPDPQYIPSLPSFAIHAARVPNVSVSLLLAIAISSVLLGLFSS